MSAHDDQMPLDVTDAEAFDLDVPAESAEDFNWDFEFDAVSQGMHDDDPNPYHGDYSEM